MKDAESSDDGDDLVLIQLPSDQTTNSIMKPIDKMNGMMRAKTTGGVLHKSRSNDSTAGSLEDLKLGARNGLSPPTPNAQTMQNGKFKERKGVTTYSENETIYSGYLWKRGKIVKAYRFGSGW